MQRNAQSGSECDFGPFGLSSVGFDSFKYMYCEIINRNMMNKERQNAMIKPNECGAMCGKKSEWIKKNEKTHEIHI